MSKGWLPKTSTQLEMAALQGIVGNHVAYEHASQGADQAAAAKHGGFVGNVTLLWFLFCVLGGGFLTLITLLKPISFLVWTLPLDLLALLMWKRLQAWKHRPIGSKVFPWGLVLSMAWTFWLCLWPVVAFVILLSRKGGYYGVTQP